MLLLWHRGLDELAELDRQLAAAGRLQGELGGETGELGRRQDGGHPGRVPAPPLGVRAKIVHVESVKARIRKWLAHGFPSLGFGKDRSIAATAIPDAGKLVAILAPLGTQAFGHGLAAFLK